MRVNAGGHYWQSRHCGLRREADWTWTEQDTTPFLQSQWLCPHGDTDAAELFGSEIIGQGRRQPRNFGICHIWLDLRSQQTPLSDHHHTDTRRGMRCITPHAITKTSIDSYLIVYHSHESPCIVFSLSYLERAVHIASDLTRRIRTFHTCGNMGPQIAAWISCEESQAGSRICHYGSTGLKVVFTTTLLDWRFFFSGTWSCICNEACKYLFKFYCVVKSAPAGDGQRNGGAQVD